MRRNLKQLILSIFVITIMDISMVANATEPGLFWEIESPAGKVSYLFGTIHTDDNRVTDFSSPIIDALKKVDLFVMETAPNGSPEHYMMQDASLKTLLTEQELDQVKVLTDFHVMHFEHALKMKPWLLAVILSQYKPQTPFAQDNLLMRQAEDFGKSVKGLETNKEHFSIIDSFSMDEQLVMLRAAIDMTSAEKERNYEHLMAVYLTGNSHELLALNSEITSAGLPKALAKKTLMKLLEERNVTMATRAIAAADEKSVFIAVGAAHLAGKTGLISAFEKAGYKLTPIKQ